MCIASLFDSVTMLGKHSDTYFRTVLCETISILEGTVYICIVVQYLSHLALIFVTHCSILFIIIHDHIKLRCIYFT